MLACLSAMTLHPASTARSTAIKGMRNNRQRESLIGGAIRARAQRTVRLTAVDCATEPPPPPRPPPPAAPPTAAAGPVDVPIAVEPHVTAEREARARRSLAGSERMLGEALLAAETSGLLLTELAPLPRAITLASGRRGG